MAGKWRIEGGRGIWLVRGDARAAVRSMRGEALGREAAAARVDAWFPEGWGGEGAGTLGAIGRALEGAFAGSGSGGVEGLKRGLRRALRDGRVTAVWVGLGAPAWGVVEEKEPVTAPRAAVRSETTWIEIRLLDDDGSPVAGERYQIDFSDGSEPKHGRLDAQGYAYLAGVAAGDHTVSFPDLDERDWHWHSTKGQPMSRSRGV